MKKLNNNGQVLVCFVILLPILLLVVALIVNLGIYGIEKRRISNTVKDTLKYGLKNIDENNISGIMKGLIIENIDDISLDEIYINVDNSYIKIRVTKSFKGVLNGFNNLKIDTTYVGNISSDGIKITEE